jgi:phosphoribosylamine--glycine ligase
MGAYSPVTLPAWALGMITRRILEPTLRGLREENIEYRGVLYMGLMLDERDAKDPVSVIEYNTRFGDPEAQVVLPLFGGDLLKTMRACASGRLEDTFGTKAGAAFCVVLASEGYPGISRRGFPIYGLDEDMPGTIVFHAGTRTEGERVLTAGGRVLCVVGMADDFAKARELAYRRTESIKFEGMHYRKDLGSSEG